MKNIIVFIILWVNTNHTFSQDHLAITDSIPLVADHFWGIDSFNAVYYTKETVFYKKQKTDIWQYSDLSLGKITQISILNPLKIALFYEDTNTVVMLDNFLTEINRIQFNFLSDYKNTIKVTSANDASLWVFDSNTQQLDIFNSISKNTLRSSQPINDLPIVQRSNFNYCWLLTDKQFYEFNTYGSLLNRFDNDGFTDLEIANEDLILKKNNALYYYSSFSNTTEKINLPKITIKQFSVTNEILYIYSLTTVYSFTLRSFKK